MTASRQYPLLEAVGVWVAMCVAVAGLSRLGELSHALAALSAVLIPNAMLWTVPAALYLARRDFAEYGLTFANWRRGLAYGLAAALVVLPLFLVGYGLLWRFLGAGAPVWRFDASLALQLATQLIAVAIPEEVFFRGYLQTLFAKAWPSARGQDMAIVVVAACFAVTHVAAIPQPQRLLVFFPGLLFGWLRRRGGSLAAPIVVHALANLATFILEGGA